MSELIAINQNTAAWLVPNKASKNQRSQIGNFADWLDENGYTWQNPHLPEYRDHLLAKVSPKSARGYLSTIRARLLALANSNGIRDQLYELVGQQSDDPLVRKAFVDEVLTRLNNDLAPGNAAVETETEQDVIDQGHGLRLTKDQASALLASPGLVPIDRLRDTAILAVFL